jgi:uncharacterized membrane protein YoaK (UPF0700 family)
MENNKNVPFLENERQRIYCILIMSGGLMGAFTLLLRGNVFCNAQTGNIVLLGMALGNGEWQRAAHLLIPISAYILGAAVSELMLHSVKKVGLLRWNTVLIGFELLVTFVLGLLPESAPVQISQISINFVCSLQFSTFLQAEGVPMATTFCTNHIRQIGTNIVKWLIKHDFKSKDYLFRHVQMLVMFTIGAAVGTLLCRYFLGKAIWGSTFLLLIAFLDLLHDDLK